MKIAFLSCKDLEGFVVDDHLLRDAFLARNDVVQEVAWDQEIDWDQFDVVLIRTTWDYSAHLPAFLEVLEKIESSRAKLFNPLSMVRWNARKNYLQELQDAGIPTIPTLFHQGVTKGFLSHAFELFESETLVVKPVVGAGSSRTHVVTTNIETEELTRIQDEIGDDDVMVQPFIREITSKGEISLHFFGGEFSHAIRKTPKEGDFRVQEEFGGLIEFIQAPDETMSLAKKVLEQLDEVPLYARVDLVNDSKNWMLIELELIEPALYFRMDPESPMRFLKAFDRFLQA
jgi:glutathione synthase/RimK-type ligase-like ATP-grasp enzyme